tara:strand:+ start:492 stop:668 length:177 start_codon:yes stop_codon:yes gene_type:complete
MSILNTPLGMNVKNNPLIFSPYDTGEGGKVYPVDNERNLSTESFIWICTEDGTELLTE